ncbi:MAG: hypothetical protein AAF664_18405 [Planctomycetota bacterium]
MSVIAEKQPSDPLLVKALRRVTQLDPDKVAALYDDPGFGEQSLEEMILRSGLADAWQIAAAYSSHYRLPFFDPPPCEPLPIDRQVASSIDGDFCLTHHLAPLNVDESHVEVAIRSPDSLKLADEVKRLSGKQMRPMFAAFEVIERLHRCLYGSPTGAVATGSSQVSEASSTQGLAKIEWDAIESGNTDTNREAGKYLRSLIDKAVQAAATRVDVRLDSQACRVFVVTSQGRHELPAPSAGWVPIIQSQAAGLRGVHTPSGYRSIEVEQRRNDRCRELHLRFA